MNPILFEDTEIIADYILKETRLAGKTILITGASGLIGSALIRGFLAANRSARSAPTRVVALVRDPRKLLRAIGDDFDEKTLRILTQDITTPIFFPEPVDHVIHAASVTASKEMISHPVEVIETNLLGAMNALRFSREKHVASMLHISSVEVYGTSDQGDAPLKEGDLGTLDLTSIRSCYPESKRLAELLCRCYSAEYDLPVKTIRPTQTFGAGIAKEENRLFAQLARCVVRKEDVVLRTLGSHAKPYCYLTDAAKAILLVLEKGAVGEVYNMANPATFISVRELAHMICDKIAMGRIKVVYDCADDPASLGYAPSSSINPDCSKLFTLGWKPQFGIEEMFARLVTYLKLEGGLA